MSRKCLAFVEKFYELYAENKDYKTIAKEMNISVRMVSKYLHEGVEWFNNLGGELHSIATSKRVQAKAKQNEALVDFLATQKENEKEYLSTPQNRYYVYLHKTLDGVVFYVGKGTGGRKDSSNGRTSTWREITKKGFTVEVYKDNLSDADATLLEDSLIANPLDGWQLVNKQRSDTKIDYSKYDWNDVFIYDETSPSCLRWKCGNGQQNHSRRDVGDIAGYINSNGEHERYKVCYKNVEYMVHRVVYQMFNGDICSGKVINHVDTNPLNNKISNLEMVTTAENNRKTEKRVYLSDEVGVRETDYKGSLSAHVYYSDVNGKKNSKKFNYSTYGKDMAWLLARKYREDMVAFVEQERVRLDKIVENYCGV